MKHPRSAEGEPLLTVTDLGEPGPGAALVDHLGAVLERLAGAGAPAVVEGSEATHGDLLDLFDAQAASRWLDVAGRRLRAAGEGRLTVASAGHEGNAAVALALRSNDPALLHHRSTAFYLARTHHAGLEGGILDVALGLTGRLGRPGPAPGLVHRDVAVLPGPTTTAGHLPRAVGLAWTIGRQQRTRGAERLAWPDDAVAVAGFGDGSASHATATGAVNAACWAARQGVSMPLLLVCEDNGFGISMPTPPGWIRSLYGAREGLRYVFADTSADPLAVLETAREAVEIARTQRRPVLLHLSCVRIGGHSGADPEENYRRRDRIAADLARDPLVATMDALVRTGALTGGEVARRFLDVRDRVASAVEEAMHQARPAPPEPTVPTRRPAVVAELAARVPPPDRRREIYGDRLPEEEGPLTLAESINRALLDAALVQPGLLLLGADVGRLGGVHGITRGLHKRLGPTRVVDVLPDEQTVLGLSLGAGVSGLLPVAELRGLADLHASGGQLRYEAATLSTASGGAYRNPLVIRVPGLAYQDGNSGVETTGDNALGGLRDVPGLVVACPAHPADAPAMLRTCLAAAEADGTVSVFLEPAALYHETDMLVPGDDAWRAPYPDPALWAAEHAAIGRASVWGGGGDLTIASYGNGLRLSMRVAAGLEREGLDCRVVDLRWLAPLPVTDVLREASATGRLLIVDEARRSGGISESLVTALLEAGYDGRMARVTARDAFVPAAGSTSSVLVTEDQIATTARALCSG